MAKDDKAQREIRKIAYALWAQEGQPEGRDREHWEAAKEIWSFQNRDAAEGDTEPALAAENQGIQHGLTDQGEAARPGTDRAKRLRA